MSSFSFASAYEPITACLLRERSNGIIIGRPLRAWARRNASVTIGELSVRIVVPMDMKKLYNTTHHAQISP